MRAVSVLALLVMSVVAAALRAQRATGPMLIADPDVEVATIRSSDPNATGELFTNRGRHVMTENTPVIDLLKFAYGLNAKQIVGLTDALAGRHFDVDAVSDAPGIPNNLQMQAMMRKLLVSRFHLTFHHETRDVAVFAMTLANGKPTMTRTERTPTDPTDFYGSGGVLNVRNASMQDFAVGLSRGLVDRPVVDQTGLTDRYDFVLKWTFLGTHPDDANAPPDLITAMREELGLKLQSTKAPLEVMVIDTIEPPTDN